MGYVQFRGTDWGDAFGSGVMKGIAIGNQYRASKAQYDYQNAIEGADADYDKAIEAAGGDKEKIAAAEKAREAAYNKAIIKNHAYLGNAEKAHQAYTDGKETNFLSDNWNPPQAMNVSNLAPSSSFANGDGQVMVASNGAAQRVIPASQAQQGMPTNANGTVAAWAPAAQAPASQYDVKAAEAYKAELMAAYKKDPSATNNKILERINADPVRRSQGVTYGLAGSGQFQIFQNGKPMGGPQQLPSGLLEGMVDQYFNDEVTSRYGKNPAAAGGVGRVGPTGPAESRGGQVQQPQQGMNLRPEEIMRQQRPAGYMNAREYLVQREMRMAQLEDEFIKRFGRLPRQLERNKLAEVLKNEETLWGNVQKENYNNRYLAETERNNRVNNAVSFGNLEMRQKEFELKAMGGGGGGGSHSSSAVKDEKFTLGEIEEMKDGSTRQQVIGANGLPTGKAQIYLPLGGDGTMVPIIIPNTMTNKEAMDVFNYAKDILKLEALQNRKTGELEWIVGKDKDGKLDLRNMREMFRDYREYSRKLEKDKDARRDAALKQIEEKEAAQLEQLKRNSGSLDAYYGTNYEYDPEVLKRKDESASKVSDAEALANVYAASKAHSAQSQKQASDIRPFPGDSSPYERLADRMTKTPNVREYRTEHAHNVPLPSAPNAEQAPKPKPVPAKPAKGAIAAAKAGIEAAEADARRRYGQPDSGKSGAQALNDNVDKGNKELVEAGKKLRQAADAAYAAAVAKVRNLPRQRYTSMYNTKLSPSKEREFLKWAKKTGRLEDLENYDLRGAYKELWEQGRLPRDGSGHLPDKYKKPNHPTFSDESIYNGRGRVQGGKWTKKGGKWVYTPGRMLTEEEARALKEYFKKVEPDAELNLKNRVTKKKATALSGAD